jgi:hypothetical protein
MKKIPAALIWIWTFGIVAATTVVYTTGAAQAGAEARIAFYVA